MRLDFSNSQQITAFLYSIALGATFCLIYDLARVLLRNFNQGGIMVFVADVLLFLVFGIVTFVFFLLFSKGTLRLYVFFGEALGFVAFRLVVSSLLRRLLITLSSLLEKSLKKLLKPANIVFDFIKGNVARTINNTKRFICKILKNIKKKIGLLVKKKKVKAKKTEKSSLNYKKVVKKP